MPEALLLQATRGQGTCRQVRILGDSMLRVERAAVTNAFLEVRTNGGAIEYRGGRMCNLVVACSPDAPVGPFEDVLTVHTSDKRRPVITVPVRGSVRGDLEIVPTEAFFGILKQGQEGSRSISLRSHSRRPFRAGKVRVSGTGIRALWVPAPQSLLKVALQAAGPGPIQGWVELTTDVPGQEKIRVPVSGLAE